jgi:hypothetical protein
MIFTGEKKTGGWSLTSDRGKRRVNAFAHRIFYETARLFVVHNDIHFDDS